MRIGRVTQTIWNRSVGKQLRKAKKPDKTGKMVQAEGNCSIPSWEESCSVVEKEADSFVWSSASVSGKAPAEVKYAVLRAAGDLAAKKVRPEAISAQFLFPEDAQEQELKEITENLTEICEKMNLEITCMQAESSDAVLRTVITVTVAGYKENLTMSCQENGEAIDKKTGQQQKKWNPGTEILFCGYTGLEGTLRLIEEAEDQLRTRFTPSFLEKSKRCKEALVLPSQMLEVPEEVKSRQCGDGGVLCGLWELAEAEKIGFEVDFSKLSLKQETVEVCEFFQLNPYLLTSAGSYLVLTEHGEETLENLRKAGVPAVRIGVVKEQNARVLVNGEETRYLGKPAADELSRWWKEQE